MKEVDAYDGTTGTLVLANGGEIHLPPVRRTIFEHLLQIRPATATTDKLVALVYAGSEGPIDEKKCMHVHMLKLARMLAGCTINIYSLGNRGREPGGYGLKGKVDIIASPKRNCCSMCGQRMPYVG